MCRKGSWRRWREQVEKTRVLSPECWILTGRILTINYTREEFCLLGYNAVYSVETPMTVAGQSKTWTVFARSNIGRVGSNPTVGMDVCVPYFRVFVVLCVGIGLATGWSPPKDSYRIKKLKKRPRSNKRSVETWIDSLLKVNRRFGGTSRLLFQGGRISLARNKRETSDDFQRTKSKSKYSSVRKSDNYQTLVP
jgi:hypothetical protein